MKKISAILLALILMFSMVAMAQDVATGHGGTASITITNAAKGATYKVAKLFDASVTGTAGGSIAYTGEIPTALAAYFEMDAAGNISKTGAFDIADATVQAALKTWAEANPTATAVSDGSELVFTELEYGYYIVTTTQGQGAITVASTNPNVEVVDKNSSDPVIGTDAKSVGDNEYKIGDTANFTVTFTATNYTANNDVIKNYTVADTPTGMEIVTESIAVKVGDEDITTSVKEDSATTIAETGMTLNIKWANEVQAEDGSVSYTSLYNSPSVVTITYSAVVTSTTGSATNKAEISYNGGTPTESEVTVTTHQFALVKIDSNNKVLAGAEFELYDALTGGTKIDLVKESDGSYRVATPAEKAADAFQSAVIVAGNVTIKGLDKDATYYLEETKAPAGYNKLTARVAVNMSTVADVAATVTDGVYVSGGVQVVNAAGSELPSTGGMGTTLFYVVGGLMMAAAVVVLVAKKKVAAK